MNEKNKLVIFVIVVFLIIGGVFLSGKLKISNSKKIYEKIETLYTGSEINVIYFGKDDCSYCQRFTPVIDTLKEKYDFDYTYVNINKMENNDLINSISLLSLDANNFGTPTLAIVQNGNLIGVQNGYTDESSLFEVLQHYGVISKDIKNPYFADDSDPVVSDFNKQFNRKENTLIYIGRPTCGYCQKMDTLLEKIKTKNDLKYYYINSDEITAAQLGAILSKMGVLTSNFGTPYIAVVSNGEVIDEQFGYVEEDLFIKFLTENKIID